VHDHSSPDLTEVPIGLRQQAYQKMKPVTIQKLLLVHPWPLPDTINNLAEL
jgi:hypothetical protein